MAMDINDYEQEGKKKAKDALDQRLGGDSQQDQTERRDDQTQDLPTENTDQNDTTGQQ